MKGFNLHITIILVTIKFKNYEYIKFEQYAHTAASCEFYERTGD